MNSGNDGEPLRLFVLSAAPHAQQGSILEGRRPSADEPDASREKGKKTNLNEGAASNLRNRLT